MGSCIIERWGASMGGTYGDGNVNDSKACISESQNSVKGGNAGSVKDVEVKNESVGHGDEGWRSERR